LNLSLVEFFFGAGSFGRTCIVIKLIWLDVYVLYFLIVKDRFNGVMLASFLQSPVFIYIAESYIACITEVLFASTSHLCDDKLF